MARHGVSRFTRAIHRYRVEGDTPVRQALAVGLGLYIGASPFIGLHLLLTVLACKLFRLNPLKAYLAANISNPFIAPVLFAAEIQVGALLRSGHVYSTAMLDDIRLRGLAIDMLIGSVVVGLVLAVAGASLTYWVVSRQTDDRRVTDLVAAAAERYLVAGIAAWELARSKMRLDPVYLQVLAEGLLPQDGRLLDLGCGQGYMLSLVATARRRFQAGEWPPTWPPPPAPTLQLEGVEMRPRVTRRAARVLDGEATIHLADLRSFSLPPRDGVLLFDVLHLMSRAEQDRLLMEVARTLAPRGVLIVREADAAGGWRFQAVRIGNRVNAVLQGRFSRRFQFDSGAGWLTRVRQLGFVDCRVIPHDRGLFANFLLYARNPRA